MSELIKEGKILHWGISEATAEYLRRAHRVCPVAAVQNRYSMMARWHESLSPCARNLVWGLWLSRHLPTACSRSVTTPSRCLTRRLTIVQQCLSIKGQFREEQMSFEMIEQLAMEKHATPAQISLAWMMSKKPWIVPIPGTRCLCRLKENIGAADISFSQEEVAAIDKLLSTMEMSEVFGGSRIVDKAQ